MFVPRSISRDVDAPGLSRCSGASGCSCSLPAYRSREMLVAD
ncbi:MAG: hypothetical protein WC593_13475 [Methanoregula sp.]